MKNKTKLHRTPRQTRRLTATTLAPTAPEKTAADRHEFLVLSFYPGMPMKPNTTAAA